MFLNKRTKFLGLAAIILTLLLILQFNVGAEPANQNTPPALFTPADESTTNDKAQTDTSIKRSREALIHFDLLGGDGTENIEDSESDPQITLNLFDDVTLVARLDHLEPLPSVNSEGYAWIGTVQDSDNSQVIFVVMAGKVSGSIRYEDVVYQIQPGPDMVHQIVEIDTAVFRDHDSNYADDLPALLPAAPTQADEIQDIADDGSTIDVMVVYTADARNGAGGTAAMESFINLNIVETNTVYTNSGVAPRIRLVHAYEVVYTESGDSQIDLNRLRATADGFMDEVHGRRNTYAADLVLLLVNNLNGNVCGRGYLFSGGDSEVFSVVRRACASGNLSFPHELGHNMGARHDWFVDATTGSAPGGLSDNHGRTYNAGSWRTIMAYNNHCSAQGGSCTRIPLFSNPDINYGGQPTGFVAGTNTSCTLSNLSNPDCDADNARVFDATANTIANFRQSTVLAAIEKSASSAFLEIGDTLTYTLDVSNLTSVTAQNVLITDTVPAYTILIPSSLSGDATYTGLSAGSLITWTTGVDLAQNEVLSRTFAVAVSDTGIFSNTAYVSASGSIVSASNAVETSVIQDVSCGFEEGFEAGVLNTQIWQTAVTHEGRVRVTDGALADPHGGNYALYLDDSSGIDTDLSTAAVILSADLTDKLDVTLDFWWREFGDENHAGDGVFISDDGGDNWVQVLSFNNGPSSYRNDILDIDQLAQNYGLVLNDDFAIKFQFEDNFPISSDGYAIDDIALNCIGPELALVKTASAANIEVGESLTYTISLTNSGSYTATNGVLTDTIPLNTTYVPGSASDGGVEAGGVITWSLGEMSPSENITRTFRVVVNDGVPDGVVIANTAYVEAENVSGLIASNTVQTMVGPPLQFIFLPSILSGN